MQLNVGDTGVCILYFEIFWKFSLQSITSNVCPYHSLVLQCILGEPNLDEQYNLSLCGFQAAQYPQQNQKSYLMAFCSKPTDTRWRVTAPGR